MAPKHSTANQQLIDSLLAHILIDFRSSIYTPAHIHSHAHRFLDNNRIDIDELKEFLCNANDVFASSSPLPSSSAHVKSEPKGFDTHVKQELSLSGPPLVKTRTLKEGACEVFEILSDSESEDVEEWPVFPSSCVDSIDLDASSSSSDLYYESEGMVTAFGDAPASNDNLGNTSLQESDTVWQDPRCWFASGISRLPRTKYWHRRPEGPLTFEPGVPTILCRQSRLSCKGAFACENVDPALLSVVHHDLDPASRDAVFAVQRETRWREGTTTESNATIFMNFVWSRRCDARDTNGNKCTGEPILRAQKQSLCGHYYFVGCSGWRKHFKEGHRMHSIPDNVDESLLAKLFSGQALAGDDSKDTLPCSCIVHPHTGLKHKYCLHAHITNGKSQAWSRIQNHPCPAARTIYVPLDPTIRKALIIHNNNTPHNHPIPPLSKAPLELKAIYRECIKATGCVGATVAKVDNAGLDVAGAFQLFFDDLKKPIDERYIQSIVALPDGGIIILTCLAALMKLLDDEGVTSFEDNTTYKRVKGDINEWEVVIFLKALQRACGYVNCASTEFFEKLFDDFQKVKLNLTGKLVGFKRFVEGGNLLVNSDMEGAQVLGAVRSFFKLNDPAYSKISNDTPVEKVAPEIIKLCTTHANGKGPLKFKSLVSEQDYKRLMDFIYIDSKEKLNEFSAFVRSLGVKKIEDWWFHKEINEWIIPCLIKSQSPMSSEDWDSTPSTTNTGEAQHHWTNSVTGTKLLLVEAIETARKADTQVTCEIEITIKSGVLLNSHNEAHHRMARNSQRQTATMCKARQSDELADKWALFRAKFRRRRRHDGYHQPGRRHLLKKSPAPNKSQSRLPLTAVAPISEDENQTDTAPSDGAMSGVPMAPQGSQLPHADTLLTAAAAEPLTLFNSDSTLFDFGSLGFVENTGTYNFDAFDLSFLDEFNALATNATAPSALPSVGSSSNGFGHIGMDSLTGFEDQLFTNATGISNIFKPKKCKARNKVDEANIIEGARERKRSKWADGAA
ncbi:hypothetical protein B0H10DRAFT_1943767 [Mycena sp. CBHHK59/15]|nr:hypothetical protein B0H10DRAFT_1943767 [Mycena sp. CBHHK59/15]